MRLSHSLSLSPLATDCCINSSRSTIAVEEGGVFHGAEGSICIVRLQHSQQQSLTDPETSQHSSIGSERSKK